jgi:hypothetical protein
VRRDSLGLIDAPRLHDGCQTTCSLARDTTEQRAPRTSQRHAPIMHIMLSSSGRQLFLTRSVLVLSQMICSVSHLICSVSAFTGQIE